MLTRIFFAALLCLPAWSASIAVGVYNQDTFIPFSYASQGGYNGPKHHQQVYASSAFPGPILITSLSFFDYSDFYAAIDTGDFVFVLSTT